MASPHIDGVEVLVGIRHDLNFGPMVVLGSGGVDCEIHDDLTYRKAPFTAADAAQMIDGLRIARKFDGWRGAPAVDKKALQNVLLSLSAQASTTPAFEINPLMVTRDGVVGVDLVRIQSEPAE